MTAPDLDALEKRLRGAADDFADHATPIEGDGQTATLLREASDMIAELKEARAIIGPLADCEIIEPDLPLADDITARYFFSMGEIRAARAFLARNGKGEG